MTAFSHQLRERVDPIWAAIFEHPFLRELAAGTLPEEAFRFYLCQDYHFLEGFARAVAIALAKAPDSESLLLLSKRVPVPVERALHRQLFTLLGIDQQEVERTALAPTTRAYVNHLIATASLGDVSEAVAAILPCPWTYQEIGRRLGDIGHPIFREWATIYKEGLLDESVRAWRSLLDKAGEHERGRWQRLEDAFVTSSRYEYLFWEMAYHRETWPV